MTIRPPSTRPVLLASLAAVAVLTTTMSTALAAPSPTPTPVTTVAPSASAKPSATPTRTPTSSTKPSSPTAASTAKPSATPSRTAAPRKLTGGVTPPTSPTGTAYARFTTTPGARVVINTGVPNGHQPQHIESATADARGNVVIPLAAPSRGWPSNTTFLWWASVGSDGPMLRGTFAVPRWSGYKGSFAAA
ncbi:hypothetical protein [Mariniluteicoccus flavus]